MFQEYLKFKKLIGGLVIGGTILTIGGLAFADSNATQTTNTTRAKTAATWKANHKGHFGKEFKGGFRMMKGFDAAQVKADMTRKLAALVKAGTITQDQANQVVAYFSKEADQKQAQFDKIKAMTPEQRKAFVKQQKPQKPQKPINPMAALVTNKVITQQQADAIAKVIFKGPRQGRGPGFGGHRGMGRVNPANLKDKLATLVSNGTLTQDQADKITAEITKIDAARKAEMDKIKAMTPEQRQAYFKQNKPQRINIWQQLVTDGILTQQQVQTIQQAFHPAKTASQIPTS